MDNLQELYQEVIIDHGTNPRNQGSVVNATHQAKGFNPLCGDQLTLSLKVDNDKIIDVKFTGSGCAISTASASLLTQFLIGKTVTQAQETFNEFTEMVTHEPGRENPNLEKLTILAGVYKYPARVKCATLAWHTLKAALENATLVTTE